MESRMAPTVFMAGLTLTTAIPAQEVLQSAAWRNASNTFSTTNEPVQPRFLAWYPAPSPAGIRESTPMLSGKSLISDITLFQANAWIGRRVANRDALPFADSFKTESLTTTAAKRLPFYITAPYWLPRSRPFPNSSNPLEQPATQGALINDVASLIRSASAD
jgi:hypothetical protein